MKVVFLLPKDPLLEAGGDLALMDVVMDLARGAGHSVEVVCLSPVVTTTTHQEGLVRVPKEPVRLSRLVIRSLRDRHSLVHVRYDSDALVAALDGTDGDVFVSDHGYMADPFLRSRHAAGPARLLVCTTIQESIVWRETRGVLGRLEARRIGRDELRVARAAHAVGTYDADEADAYRRQGIERVTWLDLTLPPARPVDVATTPPRLVFLGHRPWPPNERAAARLREWWPHISAGIPGAECRVIGQPPQSGRLPDAAGFRDLGFVDDLAGALAGARALAAPIDTGGGVRVKILEAAARGLPVVSTTAGVGSLGGPLGLIAFDDPGAFMERCRELLRSPAAAAAEGSRLHAANAAHWTSGRPRETVLEWLEA